MKKRAGWVAAWLGVFLLAAGAAWLVGRLLRTPGWQLEWRASVFLLLLNGLLLGAADLFRRLPPPWDSVTHGLALVALKLFVNTFTVFLLIGLQAVRTGLFVGMFLVGYLVLQVGGLSLLHRSR